MDVSYCKLMSSFYLDPLPNGLVQDCYKNGQVQSVGRYKNGKMDDDFRFYYESGELLKIIQVKNDEYHGLLKIYYRSGQLKSVNNMLKSGESLHVIDDIEFNSVS